MWMTFAAVVVSVLAWRSSTGKRVVVWHITICFLRLVVMWSPMLVVCRHLCCSLCVFPSSCALSAPLRGSGAAPGCVFICVLGNVHR